MVVDDKYNDSLKDVKIYITTQCSAMKMRKTKDFGSISAAV